MRSSIYTDTQCIRWIGICFLYNRKSYWENENLWLLLCGSDLVNIMVSLAGKISEFLSDCSTGAVWGDHCSNSCSLMKIQGYKSRVLKYRCTRPGNIVERQKVHFGSSLLEWNSSLCLNTNHFIYKICSLVIIILPALWKTAQSLNWHLHVIFQSHLLPWGD